MRFILHFAACLILAAASLAQNAEPDSTALADEVANVLALASEAIQRAESAQAQGDAETARNEAGLVVELLAPVSLGERHFEMTGLLWRAGLLALATGDLISSREAWTRVTDHFERTLPEDNLGLLAARMNLAITMKELGDVAGAREIQEDVVARFEGQLPADHPGLLSARENLASILAMLDELDGARALQESVLESRERTLQEDDPAVVAARGNLAATMFIQGDLKEARVLQEAVLLASTRKLPEHDPKVQIARGNLAMTVKAMGNLSQARSLFESVLEWSERSLPKDHPKLLVARENLAGTIADQGDLVGARLLLESVLEARERVFHTDHPDVLSVRLTLAASMRSLGDLAGARALEEMVLEARERTLPKDHRDLFFARQNLAITMRMQGDFAGARLLEEAVLAEGERRLPKDHPSLLVARANLALTTKNLGDFEGALALEEAVLEVQERRLSEDHPKLVIARGNLATTKRYMGDVAGARVLEEAVLRARTRTLPEGHPYLLAARQNLGASLKILGEADNAHALGLDLARGMLRRLEFISTLSLREGREATGTEFGRHVSVRFLTEPRDAERPDTIRFELAETLRATASAVGGGTGEDDPRRLELSKLRIDLNDLVTGGPNAGQSSEAFAAEISRLTFERDRLEREIRGELASRGIVSGTIRASDVARALGQGEAAVGFVRNEKWILDADTLRPRLVGDVLSAHVLFPDSSFIELELGTAEELKALVHAWRSALGKPIASRAGLSVPSGTRGVTAVEAGEGHERASGDALRVRILDPILDALRQETSTLYVCLDDFMHLVPLGALPLGTEGDDQRVRDCFEIMNEVSFARLIRARPLPTGEPALLATGGADFGAVPAARLEVAPTVAESSRSGFEGFAQLGETRREVESIGALFDQQFGEGPDDERTVLLTKEYATKAAFREAAPGKRYLHLATHGWFEPETIKSRLDEEPVGETLWSRLGANEAVTGLAPMTLCGLAFAGANHGRDSLGRMPGIMTAEELVGIDLSACELAVLSACETNVGISRAAQGVQSLQAALHAAGVRTAITSLWKVDDVETRHLMELFYAYLWVEKLPKGEALWKAQCDLRESGAPVRDWAGWVLSGDPN